MATYYARNVTGNWASNTSWDTASSGGAGPAGPPVAGDTAIFDSGFTGAITVAAAAACATLTVQAGATGSLTIGAYTLTTNGVVTLVSGFTLAGSTGTWVVSGGTLNSGGISTTLGTLKLGAATINSDGTTWPLVTTNSSSTVTQSSNLQATLFRITADGSFAFSGAYDRTFGTLSLYYTSGTTLTLPSGTKTTITSALSVYPWPTSTTTIKSGTASSKTYLAFTGADASTIKVMGIAFTDVDFSTYSTPVTNLDNWYGGTLTRCVGITNRTSADFGGSSGGGFPILGGSVVR